ncbi:MAG TPA: hypothetical protein VG734_01825 [Lacunisphaera sp.]|nr:hypothetical protein [Lacunisphaera sp.]
MEDLNAHEHPWSWDEAGQKAAAEARKKATDESIARLSKSWRQQHEHDARKRLKTLLADAPNAQADERLLLNMAARDSSLASSLWRTQVQLAARVGVSLENPKQALQLARALKEVTACRNAITKRAEELALAVGTIRVQRQLANIHAGPRLRRVA